MRRTFIIALLFCASCASWLPAPTPMPAIDAEQPGPRAQCLMVFLPGGGDSAESFEKQGFVADVLATRYSIDMVSANATMGYYTRGIFPDTLWRDVVRRRALRGYREVWVVGPSLGGFGSLLYARARPPSEVTGVFALAPYLGDDRAVFEGIKRAGGLARWQAPAKTELNERDYPGELWRWLQAVTSQREPGPLLYLGYGRDDRLAQTDALLAEALPAEHVFVGEGGHNWKTWRVLFREFLERGPLKEHCASSPLAH